MSSWRRDLETDHHISIAIERARDSKGIWVLVTKRRYAYSDRRVAGFDFERKYIRDLMTGEYEFWIRYRGQRPFPGVARMVACSH